MKKITDKRDFAKILRINGYKQIDCHGSHFKFSNGTRTIVMNMGRPNRMVMQRIIKTYDLKGAV